MRLKPIIRMECRLSEWSADAQHPEARGSKAQADQGECGNADFGNASCGNAGACHGGRGRARGSLKRPGPKAKRSEEHTSELQSHSDLVCRLLLEKKKKKS